MLDATSKLEIEPTVTSKVKPTKGVCIVAVGHPFYGRMAFNLAKTIKATDKGCPIQLITGGNATNHLINKDMWVFDYITPIPQGNGFFSKLLIDELSVFDECILMDADCIWVNKSSPLALIEFLGTKCNFTSITEGHHNYDDPATSDINNSYYFWAQPQELQEVYGLTGKIYQWRTEFIYVKKCDAVSQMFDAARRVYDEAKVKLSTLKLFAHHVPDELGINVAACIHNMHPHIYKWKPTFWHRLHNDNIPSIDQLCSSYYALSCGSNVNTNNVCKLYDRLVKAAGYKLGMQHHFPLISKREMMPERQQM